MSVKLINGDGNSAVYANQDADWFAGMAGEKTRILPINERMGYTLVSNNAINIKSGVCVTKEGRRIQIDVGDLEQITIPTGTQNVRRWYIIGFRLYTTQDGDQLAETFIEQVESASSTITEEMFKEGATEIYVSLYRIYQNGISIDEIVPLLDNLNNNINPIIDMAYPVGSIYMSTSSANPSTFFGGTWVAWGSGRVPVGVDTSQTEFNTVEKSGGEKTHTLTINEMPNHKHEYRPEVGSESPNKILASGTDYGRLDMYVYSTSKSGNNQSHNNLQPYITCYMWKRTA